ncbi:DNA-methyltransferase [Planktothrix agardhii]|jgi:adenine-specific DNA-methyltransferase|uniref:Methyltransferase n=2 Tax=Planktothrix agardhii TaxID=1160 RepID=A0A073CH62_PLAA1|nr:site-specific DNA-methyltransferase [Planktothrix agardhii]MCF3607116.1 site-specific DNA-methyltransferase [Planktothrix agardhii 1033]KEI67038.1 DNA methylase [Planktothrix agardhii NIVA-CYA 126/8]MBG0748183.1 site-specific DNA-methyltransferase [Planktothrix agardhii KL2]MCB8751278.1 site-specific DNA-methyltransferase [Planktothrix agardhii 1810]MCB8764086.1 site-specific DNA-methyltransferase [Planktothrix agardhii 1809]
MNLTEVIEILGEPYYKSNTCLIYNLDCLEVLKKIPSDSLQLTVTSPPYNIGKEYEECLPLNKYLSWCIEWIQEIYRVTNPNGAFWLNLGYTSIPGVAKAIPIPYLLWDKIPFYLIQEIIWNYGAGVAGKKFFSPRNEKFLWYVKDPNNYIFNLDDIRDPNVKYPNQKKNGKIKVNPLGKNPTDVWSFPKVTSGKNRASKERTSHPAQFPITVIDRIIKASSYEGDLIIDPFLGSGTTAIAALSLNRQVIGFEIKPEYCEIATQRIQNYLEEINFIQTSLLPLIYN